MRLKRRPMVELMFPPIGLEVIIILLKEKIIDKITLIVLNDLVL